MQKEDNNMLKKVWKSLSEEGVSGCAQRTKNYVKKKINDKRPLNNSYRDILFISGCREDLPHPWRYRVIHQREQLEAYHISTDEIYYQELKVDCLRYYRAFVFFRCPYTETIGEFVEFAKRLNKKLIYDIDDLVIDTKYTDLIPYVKNMQPEDKRAYDQNVLNMQRLLRCCDMTITTTSCLAEELKNYVLEVYINRNTASEAMVALSNAALINKTSHEKIRLGYFSGSITHNADFEMILPVIIKMMKKYDQVELYLVGELDLPKKLEPYKNRICKLPFGDWKKLPEIISNVDINLAPLEDTIFNRAKSENKWVEAALVKVVTVASNVGAFRDCIVDEETGVLCSTEQEWENALEHLIIDREYRNGLAEKAYQYCMKNCTTLETGAKIAHLFEAKIDNNFGFILPGLEISGGIKVALKHASILQKRGKDVVLFLLDGKAGWCEFEECILPIVCLKDTCIKGNIGCSVATMWTTVDFIEKYPNIKRRCYLVQNYETDFYKQGDPLRIEANRTYMPHNQIDFLTISRWCQKWLKDIYHHESQYAPNGLETNRFVCKKRKLENKIRILIEGDCAVDYKNVDEAFKIINELNSDQYEVWYMSYNAEPKEWYRVDRFLHKIPYEKVPRVYEECDILLKTSLLESFSYPPLEMMATGGYVLAVPNGGNAEYLKDEYNCLLYTAGEIEEAKEQLNRIVADETLQQKLYENGRKTAESREWRNVEESIYDMYV